MIRHKQQTCRREKMSNFFIANNSMKLANLYNILIIFKLYIMPIVVSTTVLNVSPTAKPEELVISLKELRVTPGFPQASKFVNDHKGFRWVWDWKYNFCHGIGEYGWKVVKALTMFRSATSEMLIALGDGREPRHFPI